MEPYDLEDDFDTQFADELEAMRDMEADLAPIKAKPTQQAKQNAKDCNSTEPKPPLKNASTSNNFLSDFENKSKKRERELEELFASISDSDDELVIDEPLKNLAPKRKKPRNNESQTTDPAIAAKLEDDFEITPPPSPTEDDKIMMRVNQLRSQNAEKPSVTCVKTDSVGRTGVVLTRQPEGAFISVTGRDGRRVYLRKAEDRAAKPISVLNRSTTNLLRCSMDTLRNQAELERQRKLMAEERTIADTRDTPADVVEPNRKHQPTLWVDQYSPKDYTDLLSDDGINRNILYWLKLWDTCVFGKEKKIRGKTQQEKKNQSSNGTFKQNNFIFKTTTEDILREQKMDDHNRPELKVALLCGPPGLGKTTLAHVIATHAGYNVIEMNASDDRSQDVFMKRLEAATQMQSVLSPDNRPNCLVIDEIDGSPSATINVLINYIKGSDSAKKKKKKGKTILLRPIICICNNLYVPALRPLRQIAFVSHFPPTVSSRLASRLMQIATNNALKTDMSTLLALCQKTDNDIRSCLNTLQFIQGQSKSLTLSTVSSMSIGQKDQHKSLFVLWKDTFAMPRPQRKQYVNPHDASKNGANLNISEENLDSNPASSSSRFYSMLNAVSGNGDYNKLLSGIFENYLEVKFKDAHFEAVNHACDWLIFHDRLNKEIMHSQNYILMRYLAYVPVVFHMLFASTAANRIHYPAIEFENSQKIAKCTNLLTSLCSDVSPHIKRNLNRGIAVMQVLPPLLTVIQPSFRPVNTQLFNSFEKQQMSSLVNTMIAYNLTYQQERSPDGQYSYVLDPNIEELVRFSGMPPTRQMTYAAKQLIAREIEVEKLQRSEPAVSCENIKMPAIKDTMTNLKGKEKEKVIQRHLEKLVPKKIVEEEEEKPAVDFFGRVIQKKKDTNVLGNVEVSKKSNNIWYKFNEGFTNAIRKNIYIHDLL